MDDASSNAVVKILEQAGVKKIRFSVANPSDVTFISTKKMNAADVAHGESFVGDFIEHFGVKGMRWGVRRSQKQLARASKLRAKADQAEAKANGKSMPKAKASKKTKISDLSDQELRQKLNRMNMEKQYADLTRPKGNPVKNAGKKVASNVVKGVAEQTMKNIGQSYATKYTADYLAGGKKAFDKKKK